MAIHNIRSSNRRIHRAWVLKDEFEAFWMLQPADFDTAKDFLDSWITAALRTRITSFRRFALGLRQYQDHVPAFVRSPLTNAVAEGLNRIITLVTIAPLVFVTWTTLPILSS